ncbi:phosphodiester glycosidase family protein [Paenibacillus contaminans]|uniref:Phosphodiester glycosidase family protein n=1 Tax=Paenibacillus contaminans TaxID=450362 RepID=A0A329MGB4_9BACL|nr:phosphodiester glycosidase family protein [Paenibacillus contaminans]RAV18981.1 phosphodiester glycosidase family protein [Paenibacillus contaminans]
MTQPTVSRQQTINGTRRKAGKKKKTTFLRIFIYTAVIMLSLFAMFLAWFFFTTSGNKLRYLAADTLISTQHRHWAAYLIGKKELAVRVDEYMKQFDKYAEAPIVTQPSFEPSPTGPATGNEPEKPSIEVKPIEGKGHFGYYKGYLLFVHDPKKLRIVVPDKYGKGEKVSAMVKRTGALAGVNGGGFVDPEWKGNGFQPTGIVMSGGKIFYLDSGMNTPIHIVGIDSEGKMIAGKYTPNDLLKMKMSEAVTFSPRFIVNGVGQIKGPEDGWGVAPRTSMAQTADGTIIFAIIDGRQTHSIGASLYEIQEIFLKEGAIIAANLDGGSSTVLVTEEGIVNKPASEFGERFLPTAWLVFDNPRTAPIKNVWEGVDINKIDPSKW